MLVEYFIRYQGKYYDVGTKLKFYHTSTTFVPPIIGTIENFTGTWAHIRGEDGELYSISTSSQCRSSPIVEIIEPVYYVSTERLNNRNYPSDGEMEIGWIWYTIIMVVGLIFKDRWIIWIFATAYFFVWKTGLLRGGKK